MTSQSPTPSPERESLRLVEVIVIFATNRDDPNLHAAVQKYSEQMARWAQRQFLGLTREDCEDIVQETWQKVSKSSGTFAAAGPPEEIEKQAQAWVRKILKHTVLDFLKKPRLAYEQLPLQSPNKGDEENPMESMPHPTAHHFNDRDNGLLRDGELLDLFPIALSGRELEIAMAFAAEVPNKKIAQQHGLSPGRISQILKDDVFPKLRDAWNAYKNGGVDDKAEMDDGA